MLLGNLRRIQNQSPCRDYFTCKCRDNLRISKHVMIELTSSCNFNCDFCTYRFSTREKELMSMELLEKILRELDELRPVDYVNFSIFGEPMLHPQFNEACHLVKEYGHRLIVTTNGSLLTNDIKALPIDELYISFHTPTKESFAIRNPPRSLKFKAYRNIILNFLKDVPFYSSIYLFTESKLFPQYKGLFNPNNKNSIKNLEKTIRKINPVFRLEKQIPNKINILPNVDLYLRALYPWSDFVKGSQELIENESIKSCPYYKHHLSILSDGKVTFCCSDYDGELSMGNINQEALSAIYSKKKINTDLAIHPFCKKCSIWKALQK